MADTPAPDRPDILCIGAALWDVIGLSAAVLPRGADVPGRIRREPGGVALNIATQLARRGWRPALLGAVGEDGDGADLVALIAGRGIEAGYLRRDSDLPTDLYLAIEDPEGLIAAIADARGLEAAGDLILAPLRDGRLASDASPWRGPVVLDGNLSAAVLTHAAKELHAADLRIVAVGSGKAERLTPLLAAPGATLYLNLAEATALAGAPCPDAPAAAHAMIARGASRVLVTNGAHPAAFAAADGTALTATPRAVASRRVTGAGDCFVAVHVAAELAGADPAAALTAAVAAAAAHVAGEDA